MKRATISTHLDSSSLLVLKELQFHNLIEFAFCWLLFVLSDTLTRHSNNLSKTFIQEKACKDTSAVI